MSVKNQRKRRNAFEDLINEYGEAAAKKVYYAWLFLYVDTIVESFGKSKCWEWNGRRDKDGYGILQVRHKGKTISVLAHRMSLMKHQGYIGSLLACHTCDNPACVLPSHLYGGTPRLNALDSVARGRHFHGSKTHCKSGHSLSGTNLYVDPTGKRVCRECQRRWSRDYERRKKARP